MNDKKPIHLLKGIRYLDNLNIEEKLNEINSSKLFYKEYFIDLSQVSYAELGALAKLLLIIENFLKENYIVFIALPTIKYTIKEKLKETNKKYNQSLKKNILNRRKDTNNFIKTTGFVSAVQQIATLHEKQVYITENYEFESEFNQESFLDSFSVIYENHSVEEYNYKYIFPFHWIDCSNGLENFEEIENDLNIILENPERGLDAIDVKAIKNVILSELIKNVREHSCNKYALLAIGLINSKSLTNDRQYKKTNPVEKEYLNWIATNNFSSQVEIYFGDSGVGILTEEYRNKYKKDKNGNILNREKQLELAFERWTTRKNNEPRRGTKGLYRIQRIINKYNGIVHIETGDLNGGFIKGGSVESKYLCRKTGIDFKGTLVTIKLNPFKEIRTFKYVLNSIKLKKHWNSARYIVDKELKCQEDIKTKIKESENLLLIFNIEHLDDETAKNALERLLPEISYDSHPCAIVIYLISNLKNDTIDTITDSADTVTIENITKSVNNQIIGKNQNEIFSETIHENAEEIYNPVLIIADKNQAFWYGGTKELVSILSDSFKNYSNTGIKLEDLKTFKSISKEKQVQIKLYLQNDIKLVNLDNENNIIFNFQSIDHLYEHKLSDQFIIEDNIIYCTPKLHVTHNWVNISELLKKDEYGFALCLYLKYRNFHNNSDLNKIDKKSTFVLIDHYQQNELARAFANLLGISRKNIRNIYSDIDNSLPKRTKLFPEHSTVIVLTTIISSSETARRLVKFVKRDFANADCILCLANLRKYNISKLETWNKTTDIISCFQKNTREIIKEIKDQNYFEKKCSLLNKKELIKINPDFRKEDKVITNIVSVDLNLKEFIKNNKLLHYNHIGIFNKRHFTFFIDKQRLLDIKSMIWGKIQKSIDDWKLNNNINHYRIFIPKSILNINGSFVKFLTELTNREPILFDEVPNMINESNVFYFDFGMLSGNSVNNFITSCQNVDNLFVCILFNQSTNSKIDFYKRIKTLNNIPDLVGKTKSTQFQIRYLYNLPLNFFSSEYCPICEHIRTLNLYKLEQDYLFKFSENRQEKLKQMDYEEIRELSFPIDFYYTEKDKQHELSSSVIMKMYEFKILFENAKVSTTARIDIYNEIFNIYKNIDLTIIDCESELYALIYYLSYEVNWFQHEPLVFRDIRILISEIALKIAIVEKESLIDSFVITNKSNSKSDKLAVRYKYAAISVLRSTDKLRFCENIAKIIRSTLLHEKYSDNLLQNTLYHISSLHYNKYNQSEIYFTNIKTNLEEILLNNGYLKIEQKLAINEILLKNAYIIKSIQEGNDKDECKMFKMMKKSWEGLYLNIPNHPIPFIYFNALYIEKHKNIIFDYSYNNATTENSKIILEIINDLDINWRNVIHYLNNDIYYYLEEKLKLLTNSNFFYDNYDNFLNYSKFKEKHTRFLELIYLIKENPKNYLTIHESYNKLYSYFEQNFIKKKGLQDNTENSLILNLLSEFPTSISEIIDDVFPLSVFSKRSVEFKNDNYQVYFPKKVFKRNLQLVKKNLENRLNNGVELNQVNIQFTIEEFNKNTLQFNIIYDSTNNYQKEPKKEGGSLAQWKKELNQFEGDLTYDIPSEITPKFSLHIKLKKYE